MCALIAKYESGWPLRTHFMVLGSTVATGAPVLCAIVLACKMMKMEYVMGTNPCAEVIDDADPLSEEQLLAK